MRILTWNVNVLRTCLDYHPFSSMKKKNVEGLLDELDAQIFCFQEHKTVRTKLEKSMACPGPYDAFWTFPRSKTGYSGVATYVDSRYCVPLKAEEGITGLLLGDSKGSTMKPPWTDEERIGCYPDMYDADRMRWLDEVDGKEFEPKRLDMEGRAVVCDFGLFVLFNLYCPNETNDTRRPYKMNFLHCLQERVRLLREAGREVIIAGDINIMRAPIDSGEGGIRTSAEQHYEHPARRILDDWCAPKGDMVDVVRESWPDREDMFTCWNQKLDARSANYGSRIDLILCTPGLRPWIKGGDILTKVYGSDHCPVYIDLHETIDHPVHGKLQLKDQLNPPDRTPSTAPVYPNEAPREAPEPPRFATKFYDEFSGRQTSLKSFFGGGGSGSNARKRPDEKPSKRNGEVDAPSPSPTPAPTETPSVIDESPAPSLPPSSREEEILATPFSLARAAFDSMDADPAPSRYTPSRSSSTTVKVERATGVNSSAESQGRTSQAKASVEIPSPSISSSRHRQGSRDTAIDMTSDLDVNPAPSPRRISSIDVKTPNLNHATKGRAFASMPSTTKNGKISSAKSAQSSNSQTKLSAFFSQPPTSSPKPNASTSTSIKTPSSKRKHTTPPLIPDADDFGPRPKSTRTSLSASPSTVVTSHTATVPPSPETIKTSAGLTDAEDQEINQALADAEEERRIKNEQAKPVWSNLFAKKLPPLCTVHQRPCKDYLVMKPGPNKGKRFWLCSLPVGAGYDTGRSKRPREDVNRNFRCDFFLWDSANSRKEVITSDKPSQP
ncbi:exodeoxyribonuclease III [Kwoniella sp. CBS 9459]